MPSSKNWEEVEKKGEASDIRKERWWHSSKFLSKSEGHTTTGKWKEKCMKRKGGKGDTHLECDWRARRFDVVVDSMWLQWQFIKRWKWQNCGKLLQTYDDYDNLLMSGNEVTFLWQWKMCGCQCESQAHDEMKGVTRMKKQEYLKAWTCCWCCCLIRFPISSFCTLVNQRREC